MSGRLSERQSQNEHAEKLQLLTQKFLSLIKYKCAFRRFVYMSHEMCVCSLQEEEEDRSLVLMDSIVLYPLCMHRIGND